MNKILVVVDMQNDFLTGALANESAVAIIPNIKREIESGVYDRIIFTRDTHHDNYLETQEGRNLTTPHCIYGTKGWEVCDELMEATEGFANVFFVDKPVFPYGEWKNFFETHIPDAFTSEITLVGTCTDICVASNAMTIKAVAPEATMKCLADCCAPLFGSEVKQNAALEVMKSCQIEVIE